MRSTTRLLVSTAALVVVLCSFPAFGQDASSQIRSDIQRLQQLLKENPAAPDSDFASLNSSIEQSLAAATYAVNHNQLYLALEKVAEATELLGGLRTAKNNADVLKKGLPAFESEWGKASLQLTAMDQEARQRQWKGNPAALRALAEAAQGRAIPLLDGGRGFATSTKPQDGLFYVGQAQGEADFAKFCASLNLSTELAPLPLRSFLPELQALQRKTNEAFHPPRSIDSHPRFIALNSTLKLAQELDSSRFYAGALYEYLEAVRHFGMLDAAVPDAQRRIQLTKQITEREQALATSKMDESIAQLFLQRAHSHVQHADGSAPSEEEWKSAGVILHDVLPAYFAAQKPAAPSPAGNARTVDLTLVRWPYT
jgi:hypothetical protein